MEKLKNAITEQLHLMVRYDLNAEEMLVIELLFEAIENGNTENLATYFNSLTHSSLFDILTSLQNKGIIIKACKLKRGEAFDPETIDFNENFIKFYRKTSGELGQELFETYPNEAIIQGQAVPMRNYAKKYKSEEEFYFQYGKAIG